MLKRRTMQKLIDWKTQSQGTTAILLEGARRVGKSTLVKAFAEDCYGTSSLDKFRKLFGGRVGTEYVLHPRQLSADKNRAYVPLYMAWYL